MNVFLDVNVYFAAWTSQGASSIDALVGDSRK